MKAKLYYCLLLLLSTLSITAQQNEKAKPNFVVRASGDTVLTGVPIPAKGHLIDLDTIPPPEVTVAKAPVKTKAYTNRLQVEKTKIPLNGRTFKKLTGFKAPEKRKFQPQIVPVLHQVAERIESPRAKDIANHNIRYLNTEQGINSSFYNVIYKDSKGYLWVGGISTGASRYDGQSLLTFNREMGIVGNYVFDIKEDSKGNIWIATNNGITKYDGTHFHNYSKEEGFYKDVLSIAEDQKGQLWFSTKRSVFKYNPTRDEFTYYGEEQGFQSYDNEKIIVAKDGTVWTGGTGGVYQIKEEELYFFSIREGKNYGGISSIVEVEDGSFWWTTRKGLLQYDGAHLIDYHFPGIEETQWYQSAYQDKKGKLWFGMRWSGLMHYDGSDFYLFSEQEGLSNDEVLDITEDDSGRIWVVTYGGGINSIDLNNFSFLTQKEGLHAPYSDFLMEDRNENIWMASSGLVKYDGSFFYYYGVEQGLASDRVYCMAEDQSGNIWLTLYFEGIVKFDGETFTHYKDKRAVGSSIYNILVAQNGDIWIATHAKGVFQFNEEYVINYNAENDLLDNTIWTIHEDRTGNIWIGSDEGLSKFDGENFVHFTTNEGLPNNTITYTMEDRAGNQWIATTDGVCKYDGNKVSVVAGNEMIGQSDVSAMLEDEKGNIWVSKEKGLDLLFLDERGAVINLKNLSIPDGLKTEDFRHRSILNDHQNQLWIGGGSALSKLDLNKFYTKEEKSVPYIYLNSITLNDQFISFAAPMDSTFSDVAYDAPTPFQNYPSNLSVPFNVSSFTFHFIGIDWAAPHNIRYQYQMEGLEEDWSSTSSENKADYRNLPHGTYTFKVRAKGTSNIWSEPFEYKFTVRPPWWQTIWAYLGYLLLGALAIWAYIRWRTRNLLKRQEKLEQTVTERTAEVVKEKERSEELLLNILPAEVAEELKAKGSSPAKNFDQVTILFTDFKQFTAISEQLSAEELVQEINVCFKAFDEIITKYNIEKIKTMGDAYMAAGGLHLPRRSEPKDVISAALEMQKFMLQRQKTRQSEQQPYFEMRCGIHTGPVVAGIVGVKKFQYDIWGDTVNTAARMESSGKVGKVNISQATYELVQAHGVFSFESRGKVEVKSKGEVEMYFVS